MSGRLGDLSPEQENALKELHERIKDVKYLPLCDDAYLLRFLRARKFDLDKAEAKIRATLEFRKKWGADTILQDWEMPKLIKDHFPRGYLQGFDKTDHPIVVLPLGGLDLKGMMKSHTREDLIKFKVYEMESLMARLKEASQRCGRPIETVTAIIDMHGLSAYHLWKPGLVLFSEFLQIEEMHYPEIANKGYFVRCPRIFPTIYALVKPFVDPNTREKLEVLGSNWKTRLLEEIPTNVLPEVYGGQVKEVPSVNFGSRVPKEFYKENDDTLQHQFVKPGKNFTIEVEVEREGSELSWEFVTENHDIGFSVHRLEEGEMIEVVSKVRIQAHLGNVEGSHLCDKSGTYVLEWDNSFSWTRGKNLRYKHELVPPHSEDQ